MIFSALLKVPPSFRTGRITQNNISIPTKAQHCCQQEKHNNKVVFVHWHKITWIWWPMPSSTVAGLDFHAEMNQSATVEKDYTLICQNHFTINYIIFDLKRISRPTAEMLYLSCRTYWSWMSVIICRNDRELIYTCSQRIILTQDRQLGIKFLKIANFLFQHICRVHSLSKNLLSSYYSGGFRTHLVIAGMKRMKICQCSVAKD